MPTARVIHVCSHSSHIFDYTRIHPSLKLEIIGFRMPLISYLSYQIRTFQCSLHKQFRLIECTRQRLFHIDMLTGCQSQHGDRKVGVVGGGYSHSVKVIASLIKHLTKIAETLRLRIHVHHFLSMGGTHINIT